MVKILIDGQTIEFADELVAKHVQSHISSLLSQIADQKKKMSKAEEEQEEEKKTRGEKDAATAAKDGEILALKKQLEDAKAKLSGTALDEIVKQRTELLMKADAAMEGKATFDGKEPAEIRRAVVEAKLGDAAKGLSDDEVAGAFKALTAGLKPRTGVDRLADNLSLLSVGGDNRSDPKTIKDTAYEQHIKDLNNAWRGQTRSQ